MTPYEAVWAATYAAAFVAEHGRGMAELRASGVKVYDKETGEYLFDRALASNAEVACTIADAAVAQLRRWSEQERDGRTWEPETK